MSTVCEMKSTEVINRCDKMLRRIIESRAEERQRIINNTILKREYWRKWFPWLHSLNEASAVMMLDCNKDMGFTRWERVEYLHCTTEAAVKKIRALAQEAMHGTIFISPSDLATITLR